MRSGGARVPTDRLFPFLCAEDSEAQLFFKAIANRIDHADLILFVTDAKSAFSKASEIAEFKKIQTLVRAENARGHFLQLAIVVNKFDHLNDPDLKDIYKKVQAKLEALQVDADHVFQFSSHKMLIETVIDNQLDLYLPKFIVNEAQRILQTCNVNLTKSLQKSIKHEMLIKHSDIELGEELGGGLLEEEDEHEEDEDEREEGQTDEEGEDEEQKKPTLNTGAYHRLISFIDKFQTDLPEHRISALTTHLDAVWTRIKTQSLPALPSLRFPRMYLMCSSCTNVSVNSEPRSASSNMCTASTSGGRCSHRRSAQCAVK